MRVSLVVAALIAFAALPFAGAASAADDPNWQACVGSSSTPEQRVNACAAVIDGKTETGGRLAGAHCNRGFGLTEQRQLDAALADLNEAIRLDPNNSVVYGNRGVAYHNLGQSERALADFDEAIRLAPNNPFAHMGRGSVYRARGNNARAIADYGATIRLDPKFLLAYVARGDAYRARGDKDHAIADYGEAIRLDPKFADAYYSRGLAYLYGGAPDKALADASKASDLDPQDAYKALWADIVAQHNNASSHLSQASAKIDMTPWPAPIIRMFLGRMPPEAVLAAADDPDAKKKKSRLCQANFYSGEWALRMGAKDEAVRLFQLAASGCPRETQEWFAANAELKALGAAP
jgi:lipoprotein NlpI